MLNPTKLNPPDIIIIMLEIMIMFWILMKMVCDYDDTVDDHDDPGVCV